MFVANVTNAWDGINTNQFVTIFECYKCSHLVFILWFTFFKKNRDIP